MNNIFELKIRNAPLFVKTSIGGFLISLSLAYFYAILNIAMVVGWTPKDIAIHYYGAAKMNSVAQGSAAGEQSLNLDNLEDKSASELGPRPSFKALVQEGHFHLFGMTSFFFCLTILGLFTGISSQWKLYLCSTPYLAIVFDNLSFMATRFLGPHFAYFTAVSGGMMGICFVGLWFVIGREILTKKEVIK